MMRRSSKLLLVVVSMALVAALSVGCSKDEESAVSGSDQSSKKAAAALPELRSPGLLDKLVLDKERKAPAALRYKPRESAEYSVVLNQKSTQNRGGKSLNVGTRQTFVLTRELKEETDKGWVSVLRIRDMKVTPDGKSKDKEIGQAMQSVVDALQSVQFMVTTNSRGEVLDFSVSGGDASRWKGMKDALEQLVKDSVPPLCENEVVPGDSWDTHREAHIKKLKTANRIVYDLTSTFLGYAAMPERCDRCAVVRTTGGFTIAGEITAPGMKGGTSGHGKTDALFVLDVDEGVVVSSSMATVSVQEFELKQQLEIRKGGKHKERKGSIRFSEVMETEFVQELIRPEPVQGKADAGSK